MNLAEIIDNNYSFIYENQDDENPWIVFKNIKLFSGE